MKQIYLDYNATTPVAPSVFEAMEPFLTKHYGNPSSSHPLGRAAREAIEDARMRVAGLLAVDREEIVFTAGGTDSNNLAIKGAMLADGRVGGHMIISNLEHPAVVEPARFLEKLGCAVTTVRCDRHGVVHPSDIEQALRDDTTLVSIIHANNEIGTLQPIRQIAEICRDHRALVHTDASQAVGKVRTYVDELGVDMLTIAGHKLYAPKGVGALYIREGVRLEPHIHGGDQENGFRAGTENTAGIVGLGQACLLASRCLDESFERMTLLRDRLADQLQSGIGGGFRINGQQAPRLPNTLSAIFPGVDANELLARIPEICASTGSACHSQLQIVSPTLQAIGLSPEQAASTVRLSVGWYTSEEDIDRVAGWLVEAWQNLHTLPA